MDLSLLHLGAGIVVLLAVGLFVRALLRGGRMIGKFQDDRQRGDDPT